MSDGNLSRIENGLQGPPNDQTIEQLAKILQADPIELLELAGRTFTTSTFDTLREELSELREIVEQGLAQLANQASSNSLVLQRIERALDQPGS